MIDYTEAYPSYIESEQERCDTMISILEAMDRTGVSLLDNEEFLQFAATESNFDTGFEEELEGVVKISVDVREAFLTEEGAGPINDVASLSTALDILF